MHSAHRWPFNFSVSKGLRHVPLNTRNNLWKLHT
ncbi:hypothetical protein ROSA5918_19850 [Roseateles saccharophilus]|uniref:Uncharacterized protein n=1 Tax=Roseateles saccharophilus TaxID=304 RepID=A0A4R3UTH5_ROSSA|nr:hypothetical protein EV671_10187 [Roseateles saccharophilus]